MMLLQSLVVDIKDSLENLSFIENPDITQYKSTERIAAQKLIAVYILEGYI